MNNEERILALVEVCTFYGEEARKGKKKVSVPKLVEEDTLPFVQGSVVSDAMRKAFTVAKK